MEELAIVVTAFFPIPSKYSLDFYLATARTFFKNCPAKIIVFTTSIYAAIFKTMIELGKDVTFYEEEVDDLGIPIECPVKNWVPLQVWERCAKIINIRIPRYNNNLSIQLIILYLSKAWFVNKAILSISQDKAIVWHDIGSARAKEQVCRLRKWPLISKLGDLSDNKIRFFKRRILPSTFSYDCDNDSFIAGSHIFGNKNAWSYAVDDIKNAVLDNISKYNDGIFDETIYLKLLMTLPERYLSVGSHTAVDYGWFQTFELHGDNKLVFDVYNNTGLIIYPSHEESNQIFSLIKTENNECFSIKSKSNNLAISDNNGVCFQEYTGSDDQLFTFTKITGDYGYLENKATKKVLDVSSFGRDRTAIVSWGLNGGNNQLFRFLEVNPEEYQIQVNYI